MSYHDIGYAYSSLLASSSLTWASAYFIEAGLIDELVTFINLSLFDQLVTI